MSEDKSKIIELSSSKGGQKEATSAMGSGQVILQSIECSEDELYRRLALVYEILLNAGQRVKLGQNANSASADNTHAVLTPTLPNSEEAT